MKKIILGLTLVSLVALTGCGNVENDDRKNNMIIEQQEESFDAKDYAGTWKASSEEDATNYVEIKVIDSNMINFQYMMVSPAPDYRVASIESENVIIDKDGVGEFTFEEDGWHHRGNGTLKLTTSGIEVDILNKEYNEEVEDESLWGIDSGKYDLKIEEQ